MPRVLNHKLRQGPRGDFSNITQTASTYKLDCLLNLLTITADPRDARKKEEASSPKIGPKVIFDQAEKGHLGDPKTLRD